LAKTISIKPEEWRARSYADRLILEALTIQDSAVKLGELAERLSGAGLGLGSVKALIASNPERFSYSERRWVPSARLESIGRPFGETIRLLIERFGAPMPLSLILQEVSRVRREDQEALLPRIERSIEGDPIFIRNLRDEVALSEWAFLAEGETVERALAVNGLGQEEYDDACKRLAKHDWRKEDAIESALKEAAPISAKALGAAAWSVLNPEDARAILLYEGRGFFAKATAVDGYVYGADGVLYPEAETKKWISAAVKLADKLAPTVEIEDAAPVDIKSADVERMVKKILDAGQSVAATRLLEEFYEITTSSKTFPDDLANVVGALQAEKKVWWVGADRFRKPDSAPDFVHGVPELFQFSKTEFRNEEGDLFDIELTDDGLSSSLRKLLSHPLATDVLDEDPITPPKQIPEKLRLVLKSIHRELGTFPMSQVHGGWLDPQPKIQELVFVDSNGRELQVWANFEARLLYNLVDWWYEQPIESGAVFTLEKSGTANTLRFAWEEQTDPLLYISSQRMEELRELQGRSESLSTLDILIEVMHHWPKGADFLTLLAEVNVVRRTRRRLAASLLSSYQCFYQRSGSPVWHFDAKKVDLGFDKTKKKFVVK